MAYDLGTDVMCLIQYCKKKKKKEGQQCHLCDHRHPNEKITVSLGKQLQHTPIRRDLKEKVFISHSQPFRSVQEKSVNSLLQITCVSPQGERKGSRVKCLRANTVLAFIIRGERMW